MRWVRSPGKPPGMKRRLRAVQTDGSMLVSRFFWRFLPGPHAARGMSVGQRLTAILHTISKLATVTLAISLLLLPLGLWPAKVNDYVVLVPKADHERLRILFLAAYMVNKFNRYCLYGRVGTKNAVYATRNRIWSAPCKHRMCLRRTSQEYDVLMTFF